jgi:hypothetical protein
VTPEEVTELSPEERVYFGLLEERLLAVLEEYPPLFVPPRLTWVDVLSWLVVFVVCAIPWAAIALIIYVIVT